DPVITQNDITDREIAEERTVLVERRQRGPLAVQKALYQEGPEICSGGDNLAATFSPELADLTIYIIDVAAGEKIPRKGGPGITKSDLLVINKIDLAPYVGADLDVMRSDAQKMRAERPFVMCNLKAQTGVAEIIGFLEKQGLLT